MTTRVVLKCDPKQIATYDVYSCMFREMQHDALAAACYQQAIEAAKKELNATPGVSTISSWIEQRAAELLAEKLR